MFFAFLAPARPFILASMSWREPKKGFPYVNILAYGLVIFALLKSWIRSKIRRVQRGWKQKIKNNVIIHSTMALTFISSKRVQSGQSAIVHHILRKTVAKFKINTHIIHVRNAKNSEDNGQRACVEKECLFDPPNKYYTHTSKTFSLQPSGSKSSPSATCQFFLKMLKGSECRTVNHAQRWHNTLIQLLNVACVSYWRAPIDSDRTSTPKTRKRCPSAALEGHPGSSQST